MPQAVFVGIGLALESTLGAFLITNSALLSSGALLLGGLALSAKQAQSAKRKARDQFNASQVDRLANVSATTGPRELVLGRVRKGGNVFFRASTGVNNTTFIMCVALAGHEIDAVESIYLNDQAVTLDGSGYLQEHPYNIGQRANGTATADGTGSVTLPHEPIAGTVSAWTGTQAGPEGDLEQQLVVVSGSTITTAPDAHISYQYFSYASKANIRVVTGATDQVADARIVSLMPSIWTAAHRARAVAYLICEFTYDETAFPSGIPSVTAVVRGAKLYDPRENRLTYSEQFDNAAWVNANTTETANATAAPGGSTTADKIVETTAASTTHWIFQDMASVSIGQQVTWSVYAKAGERTFLQHRIIATGAFVAQTTPLINVNLSTGVIDGSQGIDSASIEPVGNGWYRVSITATPTSAGIVRCSDFVCITSGNNTYTGDGSSGLYLWGAQAVHGELALAYTPTTSAIRAPTTAWSENPALMMRYVYAHAYFGKGTPTAEEDNRIITAANACDVSHDYVVDGVTTAAALYRAAMVVPFGAAAKDVFDDLAQAMAGAWAWAGGELYIKAGVWTDSVMTLTEADLADVVRTGVSEQAIAINITVHREQVQKFNTVVPTIWDAAQGYKQTPLPPLVGAALLARDGKSLSQPVSMPAVGYAAQALHIAGVLLRDARDPLTVTLAFKLKAYPLELFDTIALTLPHYGWSEKLFVVLGRDWTADGNLSLTLKETAEEIYTPDAEFSAQGYAANTSLPEPWSVPDMGALTVTSGTDDLLKLGDGSILTRMRVTWSALTDSAVLDGGTVEVQYRAVLSDGAWSRAEVSGSETQVLITDVQDAGWYNVRARAKTRLAIGVWSEQALHQVIGKTEAPPAFDRFLVLAQPDGTRQLNFGYTTTPAPVDWRGAQIRYVAGSSGSPDWDTMTALSDTTTYYTASPVEANAPPAGEYTFACKSVDTSGNTSSYLLQTITLPDRRLGSVFDEFDERADGWAGTLTDCAVNADGDIEAGDSTTWATLPATWALWTRWNYAPASPIVYETPAQDLGAAITGQISTTLDVDGSDLVELATSDDGSTWSSWGSVGAAFAARHVKLRLTLTATGGEPVPLIRQFQWLVDAPLQSEYINDVDISALTGSYRIGTGDVRVPMTLALTTFKRLSVVIQDSTAGTWSWQLIDKTFTYGPRVQFKLGGTLTDPAFVDFFIEGF